MTIQSTRQICTVLHNAAVFNFKNSANAVLKALTLPFWLDRLFVLLKERNLGFTLVGGIALLTHVEGRNTRDVDLILSPPSLAKMPEIKITDPDMYFARGRLGELQIDSINS